MKDKVTFSSVTFKNYKAFQKYSLSLREFNILVGPNNCGKSTILGVFRILAEGIRKANARRPAFLRGINGIEKFGYEVDLKEIPVATENIFFNYNNEDPALVTFNLSNGNSLILFFPEQKICYLFCESENSIIRSPIDFKKEFPVEVGFVPILGPVDHKEPLYQREAARLALLTFNAARNFRNIWFHYPDEFKEFKELITSTWPGMDIDPPEKDYSTGKPILYMYCPESRIPREIFWAGFGFQVWCQMLTYIIRNKNASLFIIDEPDIYLHSDLQRQLLTILKALGPDIMIATHSTEIISEAEINDIVLINKKLNSGQRIKDPAELQSIFQVLGSNLNPTLTQIAKTRKVLFVEGKDFSILGKIARKLGKAQIANRSEFAVIPVEGFNPNKARDFKAGIEKTIGTGILSGIIFDRDQRTAEEVEEELNQLRSFNSFAHIHSRKEIENLLLIPTAINKAILKKKSEREKKTGVTINFSEKIEDILDSVTLPLKNNLLAQFQAKRYNYEKSKNPSFDPITINEKILNDFEEIWKDLDTRLTIVPGKEIISKLNQYLQEKYKTTISITNIIESMVERDIPADLKQLINVIDDFRQKPIEESVAKFSFS